MKPITVVVATAASSILDFEKRPIFKSLQKQYDLQNLFTRKSFDFVIQRNNKSGLSSVYNKFLKDPNYKNHILLFVHDDVELEDIFLVEKLQNSPYSVTGLAGTKKADLSKIPAWHLMSHREDWVGEVAHSKDDQTWTTLFGPTKSRALLLDGLFLAVDVKKLLESNTFFDEDFEFHHYDISFCLRCNANKVTLGVQPIRAVHHGLGDSMNTEEWKQSAAKFTKKYGI